MIQYKPSDSDIRDIKGILGIQASDVEKDDHFRLMLPMLLEAVMEHTNNTFNIQADGTTVLPGPVKIYLAKALERNSMQTGLKSRSMGSVSYSYDTSVPAELMDFLKPYRKVRFHASR